VDSGAKPTDLNFKKIQKFKKGVLGQTFANRSAFIFEPEHFLATFEFKRRSPWVSLPEGT
jgi:hypothetical protein